MNLPGYPSHPKRFQVRQGLSMNYLDEGPRDGEVVVMLHGNPSWSYYWRTLVAGLSDTYRCIVPDHIGMGLSDKPDDSRYEYTLQSRVDDVAALLKHLGFPFKAPENDPKKAVSRKRAFTGSKSQIKKQLSTRNR